MSCFPRSSTRSSGARADGPGHRREAEVTLRLVIGLGMTAAAFWFAGRRLLLLYRLGRHGQPVEPGRTDHVAARLEAELVEVLGQRKLLKWTVPL